MSVELEKARGEILSLKRELAAIKLENRKLLTQPSEESALRARIRLLESDLKEALFRPTKSDLAEAMSELRSALKMVAELELRPTQDHIKALKADLSKANTKIKELELRPTKDDLATERKSKLDAEAKIEAIWADLKEARQDIARFQAEQKAKEEKVEAARESFIAGPNVKEQQLRQRLKEAEAELWRLKDVRDK